MTANGGCGGKCPKCGKYVSNVGFHQIYGDGTKLERLWKKLKKK